MHKGVYISHWSQPLLAQDVTLSNRDRDLSLLAIKSSRVGHPSGEGPFPGGCWDDVKVPSRIITSSVWIALGKICSLLQVEKMACVQNQKSSFQYLHDEPVQRRIASNDSTIISHRTSVASVLCHWQYDPAADPHIKLLVRAFRLERPVQRKIMPKWDLHLVLSALMSPPFVSKVGDQGEISDRVIPLKWQTMETATVLPLASASARRRSYLHALSVAPGRCVFSQENSQRQLVMSLLLEAGFLAKNQPPSQAPQWISVPGIAHLYLSELERLIALSGKWSCIYGIQREGGATWYSVSCVFWRSLGVRIHIYETWLASLMGCQLWVQWWSHNKSWIQDIFSNLHSLHDLYAPRHCNGENLVTDERMPCSAQVWLRMEARRGPNFLLFWNFRLGSASEPNICSHCYSMPYMKRQANNQVIFMLTLKQLYKIPKVNMTVGSSD